MKTISLSVLLFLVASYCAAETAPVIATKGCKAGELLVSFNEKSTAFAAACKKNVRIFSLPGGKLLNETDAENVKFLKTPSGDGDPFFEAMWVDKETQHEFHGNITRWLHFKGYALWGSAVKPGKTQAKISARDMADGYSDIYIGGSVLYKNYASLLGPSAELGGERPLKLSMDEASQTITVKEAANTVAELKPVKAAAISADSRYIAALTPEGELKVWDLGGGPANILTSPAAAGTRAASLREATRKDTLTLEDFEGPLVAGDVSPGRDYVAAASPNRVYVWSAPKGELLDKIKTKEKDIDKVGFSGLAHKSLGVLEKHTPYSTAYFTFRVFTLPELKKGTVTTNHAEINWDFWKESDATNDFQRPGILIKGSDPLSGTDPAYSLKYDAYGKNLTVNIYGSAAGRLEGVDGCVVTADWGRLICAEDGGKIAVRDLPAIVSLCFTDAEAVLDASIRANPADASPYVFRALLRTRAGRTEEAVADYSKAIELSPNRIPAYMGRAVLYNVLKEYNKALADASRAIELDPKNGEAYTLRGLVYEAKGDTDAALAEYEKATEDLYSRSALALYRKGMIFAARKDIVNAGKAFMSASVDGRELNGAEWAYVGIYELKIGGLAGAEEALAKAVALDPNIAMAWDAWGQIAMGQKDYDKAFERFSRAQKLSGDMTYSGHWTEALNAKNARDAEIRSRGTYEFTSNVPRLKTVEEIETESQSIFTKLDMSGFARAVLDGANAGSSGGSLSYSGSYSAGSNSSSGGASSSGGYDAQRYADKANRDALDFVNKSVTQKALDMNNPYKK